MRWISLIGLFMMLVSATPMGVAAQNDLLPVGDVAQDTGAAIELLVVDCEPGTTGDPSELKPGCTEGRAGISVNVAGTDEASTIDLPKTTETPAVPGPGVINTGAIPVGEYRIQVDLPVEENDFFFKCYLRGTETEVQVTADPNGAANAFLVSSDAATDTVCTAYVIPLGAAVAPTIDITYRECARADMPADTRTFEELRDNCTTVSTAPPTFNVRHLNEEGEPVTEHQVDAEGNLLLTLTPGSFDLFTDLGMEDWGEYLFCEYEGQPRYEKDFHETRGIVTFNDLEEEQISCSWFAVNGADDAADDSDTPEQGQTPEVDAPDPITPDDPDQGNDDNDIVEPEPTEGEVQFTITYRECTRGDFPSDQRSHQDLIDNCTQLPETAPVFTIVNQDQTQTNTELSAEGVLSFTHAPEDFSIYSNLDPEVYGEYLHCEFDGGEYYEKPFPDSGINSFQNLNAGEVFNCDWYGVMAVEEPGEDVPPVEEPEVNSSMNITLMTCPNADEMTWDASSADAFRTNCDIPTQGVAFAMESADGERLTAATSEAGVASFPDVADGSWGMYSDIPLSAATEYYFCSVDDGAFTNIPLSERGVATFNDLSGQQINCEIYVVPENLRGDVTGASLEVHAALCPANYEGDSWYSDCHDEGLADYEFTLSGPGGDLTGNTVVERDPGPGIVRFTELAAGDYTLAGGPPQHDGTVFLYCSDPSTGTEIPTSLDGVATFSIAENQSVVCDWYFTPTSEEPVTPEPEPATAEIFTTMFICPPEVNVAGAGFSDLDTNCGERLNDVPMTLQRPGGVPITANTGESGDGAIRFYELTGGDYVLTPTLPAEYVSAAVYCDLDGGSVYQKALTNGSTTFVNVEDELISCSWFVTAKPQPAPEDPGPTGSITVREMLCEGDRSSIKDWERECQPGSSGASFTINSVDGSVSETLTPNAEGVAVFEGLPNGYYELQQSDGAWCRARAERVDSQSRVGVSGGGNTDVFLYQCNQEIGLPETGTGSGISNRGSELPMTESILFGIGSLPLLALMAWQIRRSQIASGEAEQVVVREALTRTRDGYRYR